MEKLRLTGEIPVCTSVGTSTTEAVYCLYLLIFFVPSFRSSILTYMETQLTVFA